MVQSLSKGPRELRLEVLDEDLCTGCGACLGICPHLRSMEERIALIQPCVRTEGRCYKFCPRTSTDVAALDAHCFGQERNDVVLGHQRRVVMARARDEVVRRRAQYGGVVTALSVFALGSGAVDGVVANDTQETGALPRPVVARDPATVVAAAGSKYTSTPTLRVLNEMARQGEDRLAIVGRGCQVAAARKMQLFDPERSGARVSLVIGLFCFWALRYRPLLGFLKQQLDVDEIERMDIPKGEFVVYLRSGQRRLPVDAVRPFIQPGCNICFDVTAELADVSVGSTEWLDDWNTLIVRSAEGEELVDRAVTSGALEIQEFPEERVTMLRDVALAKKRRVITELEGRGGSGGDLLYLQLSSAHRRRLDREAGR